MHYYKRNIGDYHKKAGRLTMLQHGAYTLLLDACYDREKFPTLDEAVEWLWASSDDEINAIKFVLAKFFTLSDGVYVQHRIKSELNDYAEKALTNKRIAIEREQKRRLNSTNRAHDVDESKTTLHLTTNQEPLTINQTDKDVGDKSPVPLQQVLDAYHELLPMMPRVQIYTDKRKSMVRTFWKKRSAEHKAAGKVFTIESLRGYFNYIANHCQWMLTDRDNGKGGMWKAKNFDYVMKDDCYVAVKEQRFDNKGNY